MASREVFEDAYINAVRFLHCGERPAALGNAKQGVPSIVMWREGERCKELRHRGFTRLMGSGAIWLTCQVVRVRILL
jgi:hypothetical protein